jgi:uncharacterized membrane protein
MTLQYEMQLLDELPSKKKKKKKKKKKRKKKKKNTQLIYNIYLCLLYYGMAYVSIEYLIKTMLNKKKKK